MGDCEMSTSDTSPQRMAEIVAQIGGGLVRMGQVEDLLAMLAERDATILRLRQEHSAATIAAHRDYSETLGRLQAENRELRAQCAALMGGDGGRMPHGGGE